MAQFHVALLVREASFIIGKLVASTGPLQDKDPYDGGMAVVSTAPTKAKEVMLFLTANTDDDEITLKTFYDKDFEQGCCQRSQSSIIKL